MRKYDANDDSDPILRAWMDDRIPQTPITIGSQDQENTNSSDVLLIK